MPHSTHIAIHIASIPNFRSLHGLPAADGRRLQGHRVLRSGRLNDMTAADWAALQGLGLKTVCDLRSAAECERAPTALPQASVHGGTPTLLQFGIDRDVRADEALAKVLTDNPTAAGARQLMLHIYRAFPQAFAARLERWLALFEHSDAPVLVHCTAGKDRTGFLVAMLLSALGMAHEVVLADYLRSAQGFDAQPARVAEMQLHMQVMTGVALAEQACLPILDTRADYLQAALEVIDAQHGSVAQYLHDVAGFDHDRLARLRDRLLS